SYRGSLSYSVSAAYPSQRCGVSIPFLSGQSFLPSSTSWAYCSKTLSQSPSYRGSLSYTVKNLSTREQTESQSPSYRGSLSYEEKQLIPAPAPPVSIPFL